MAKSHYPRNFCLEAYVALKLTLLKASYYKSLIRLLRWIVDLRRGNLEMEESIMASLMNLLHKVHLSVALQMLSFLKRKYNDVAVFDSTDPEIDETNFTNEDWSETPYGTY